MVSLDQNARFEMSCSTLACLTFCSIRKMAPVSHYGHLLQNVLLKGKRSVGVSPDKLAVGAQCEKHSSDWLGIENVFAKKLILRGWNNK